MKFAKILDTKFGTKIAKSTEIWQNHQKHTF